MVSKLDIPLHGPAVNIVRQSESALSDVLQSKFGCAATITGVDFEGHLGIAQQKRPAVVPERRFEVMLDSGILVSVWKADLANFPVDAVVNAANDHLNHGGGLALALSKAGGPQIQKESEDYIKKYGVLKTGDAIVMDAGSLPCKKIIHAVGPLLPKYPSVSEVSVAEPLLKRAIWSILDRVKENHLKTVAIPAISSGLFSYPLPQCADTIVTTVRQYCEYSSAYYLKEIQLVNIDEPTVKEMERACHQILCQYLPNSGAASKSRGDAKTSTPTVQVGNVHLTLKRGHIEDERTDVIVNTTSKQNWNGGQISRALLQKAGTKMEDELNTASMKEYFMVTKSYKLLCKEVYHTFCTDRFTDNSDQILWKSVLECLWLAATKDHKSIAFPAIGTGGHGFRKKDVAAIMSDAVLNFAQNSRKKMEVYFVIYPSDNETFKAFEEQMRDLQQKASALSFTHVYEPRDDFHGSRASTPQISLSGPSDEATREAERWLHGLLFLPFGNVHICNNFILHFGKQEHLQLSRIMKRGISMEEVLERGRASIIVHGDSNEDVVVAALQVEAILCNIQREFIREEEHDMSLVSTMDVSFERKAVEISRPVFSDKMSAFQHVGLQIVKVDMVENYTLKLLFDLKKNQLGCTTSRNMFQCVPAQFCDMVSRIGFHAEYAPPDDPAYGEGIYFAGTVKKVLEVWKEPNGEYLHLVEAEVLTGNSTPGKPGLILPPAVGTEPLILYDSVSGGPDISVIFSGYQALPKYIFTCKISKV